MAKLSTQDLRDLERQLTAAHLWDRLTVCGCSKTTLRICTVCRVVSCACAPACCASNG